MIPEHGGLGQDEYRGSNFKKTWKVNDLKALVQQQGTRASGSFMAVPADRWALCGLGEFLCLRIREGSMVRP